MLAVWLILKSALNKWWVWAGAALAAVLGYFKLRESLATRRAMRAERERDSATAGQIAAQREREALAKQRERELAAQRAKTEGERKEHEIKTKTDDEVFDDLDHAFDDFDGKLRGK